MHFWAFGVPKMSKNVQDFFPPVSELKTPKICNFIGWTRIKRDMAKTSKCLALWVNQAQNLENTFKQKSETGREKNFQKST